MDRLVLLGALRPMPLLRTEPLLAFGAGNTYRWVLGGLSMFGAVGLIIGPVIAGLFMTVWEIYGTTFRDVLPGRPATSE